MEELRSLREIARQARTGFGSATALRRIRCVFENGSKEVCRQALISLPDDKFISSAMDQNALTLRTRAGRRSHDAWVQQGRREIYRARSAPVDLDFSESGFGCTGRKWDNVAELVATKVMAVVDLKTKLDATLSERAQLQRDRAQLQRGLKRAKKVLKGRGAVSIYRRNGLQVTTAVQNNNVFKGRDLLQSSASWQYRRRALCTPI